MRVEELLVQKQIPFLPKGKDYIVRCLNPEHDDSNPSMRIDQVTGIFNCFACGHKGNLFNTFGETPNQLQLHRETLKKLIAEKRSESVGLAFPTGYIPYKGNWRNISPKTYEKFQAFQHHSGDYIGRIVFPIFDISGRIVAFQGRHTTGGVPKYKFTPPGAKLPLYPKVDPVKGKVVLVEGIYDMINLYDKGLQNAVCCFGTNNIKEEKLEMLKIQGIEGIDIFFDGDDAGQEGAKKVVGLCEKVGLAHRNIHLENKDPGGLTESQVIKLRNKLYG